MKRPVTHLSQPSSPITLCCDKHASTLPIGDQLVSQPDRVTCGREER